MYRTLIALCLLLPGLCYAQPDKFNFGFSVPLYLKYNVVNGENTYRRLFGATGIDALLKINGSGENSMSIVLDVGLTADSRPFRLDVSRKLRTDIFCLNINPSVTIPSKWQHIQYCLGIGTLVRLEQHVNFISKTEDPAGFNTGVDTVYSIINSKGRSIIPFISLGFSADVGKHLKLQFTVEPTLIDFYEPDTHVNYIAPGSQHDFVMAYEPVYVGFKLCYFIHPSEM